MFGEWSPSFSLSEADGRCRLSLCGIACGEGETLQEAADDLVVRLLAISISVREAAWTSGIGLPDPRQLAFLWEFGRVAASGQDVRQWLFRQAPGVTH